MAEKVVKVVIDGKETVSHAADKAEGGIRAFAGRAMSLLGGLAALGVGAALGGFFRKAIEESLEGEVSMARMRGAVRDAGESFTQMQPQIDATVKNLMRLSTFTDDELNNALADMTNMSGDAKGALGNLSLAADVAARTGKPLEEVSQAIGKAMAGNTKALFAMIPELRGSSDALGTLRERFAGAAEEMSSTFAGSLTRAKNQFNELAQAVGDAILGSDGLTGSGNIMVDMLAGMAAWVESNKEQIGKFVDALVTLTKNLVDALMPAFQLLWFVAKPIIVGITALVTEASFVVRTWAGVWEMGVGKILEVIGALIEKGGTVLKAFGINVVANAGASMKAFGEKFESEGAARLVKVEGDWKAFHGRMKTEGDKAVDNVEGQEKKKTRVVKTELVDQEKAMKAYADKVREHWKIIDWGVVSYKETLKTMAPAVKAAMETTAIDAQNRALDASRETADALIKKMREHGDLPPLIKQTEGAVKDVADRLADAARTALDLAQAFGAANAEAASVLNSAINIGSAIGKLARGDVFAGVSGILGGVANIVTTMMGDDAERRRLLKHNNDRLRELNVGISNLDLNVSGEDMTKAGVGLEKILPLLAGNNETRVRNFPQVLQILSGLGLTLGDLGRIADELGMSIKNKEGQIDYALLPQLLEGIKATGNARVGTSFADQLGFFQESQRLSGAGGTTRINDLMAYLKDVGGVSALGDVDMSDASSSRNTLFALLTRLNNGGLSQASLGKLSGGQLRSLITEMIDDIDGLKGNSGGPITGDTGSTAGGGSAGAPPSDSAPTAPVKTLDNVVEGIVAQTEKLGAFHAVSLGFQERTANATEATAENTAAALAYLAQLVKSSGASSDDTMGRRLAVERRLAGNPSL